MDREALVKKICPLVYKSTFPDNAVYEALVAERTGDIVNAIIDDLGLSITSLRQVGWMSTDQHILFELEAEDDYHESDWVPVYVPGKDSVGLPPIDLDSDDGWSNS